MEKKGRTVFGIGGAWTTLFINKEKFWRRMALILKNKTSYLTRN